ncbi:Transcriptional regulatory protein, C terminal [Nonomuraea pusilla]|uniref:Transcriptional regulatory protein, C terminal n=2 Tax=Nonomuraea pusilla TaxID=46177 RepID=A0A1H8HGH1_9ACTN|nr:Transcriptional regulatory protein, C terminal [Nonomuraea pusilla]
MHGMAGFEAAAVPAGPPRPGMEFRVLGPLEVRDGGGGVVGLGGPRQRAVLARLTIAAGAVVSTDTLIDDLYRGAPPATALASLHVYVAKLRRAIEPERAPRTPPRLLVARRPGYLLDASRVDALRFAALVADAEHRPAEQALPRLDEALGLWRGTPYGEFSGELWAVTEVNRLRELRLVAIERRAEALLGLGRPQAVINDLECRTSRHPLRERLWWLLALALYRSGRQADALATLRRARSVIAGQLGLDPGPALQALEDDILRQVPSLSLPPDPVTLAPAGASAVRAARPRLGRDAQLAQMELLLHRGDVSTVAVSGEPGIGKTWLLEAFRERCDDLGRLVLWGGCQESEGTLPLWPWIQVLRSLSRLHPPADRQALAGLLDEEEQPGPGAGPHRHRAMGAGPHRHRAMGAGPHRRHAVAAWLAAAARARPLVIVFDDLQWADLATLDLLGDVMALVKDAREPVPLTVVVAFHDSADLPAVESALGRLARYDLLRLRLTGLDAGAVQALAAATGSPLDERAARRLTRRTGGNPFFVRETLGMLAQGHPLDALPDAVASLVQRRLAAAGPRVTDVLQVAAVLGRDFDPDVVAHIRGTDGVYDLLDQAVRAGLVVPTANRMAFAHDLVRETLIRDIPPLRKATIHREAMNALAARPGVELAVIARHAIEAGPAAYAEAVHWARAMAEQATLRLAYEEAAVWWSHAVKAHGASAGDPADHVELLLRQARALLDAGDAIGARNARAQAIPIADRAGDGGGPRLVARALTALDAPSIWHLRDPCQGVDLQLVHRFELALRTLPDQDGPERARLLAGLAQELQDGTGDPRCDLHSAEAVETARRLDDPQLLMRMLNARYLSLPSCLRTSGSAEVAEEIARLARRTRTPEFELLAAMMLTHRRMERFDVAGADRAAARCDRILHRMPLPWPRFQHAVWRAGRLAVAGRFDEAEAAYADAERQAGRLGVWHAGSVVALGRVLTHYLRGTIAEAGRLLDAVAGVHPCLDQALRVLARTGQDRREEARKAAAGGWLPPPLDWSWLTATCLQGAAQTAVGDVEACRATYSALVPYSGRMSVGAAVAFLGPVDWFLALLASAAGDQAAAVRHLLKLARLASRGGLSVWRNRVMAAAGLDLSPVRWDVTVARAG